MRAQWNETAVAKRLLEGGADVNAKAGAAAPLHGAVMGGSAAMVRLLLEHDADPSLRDYKGRGARQPADDMGRSEIAVLFD
jgi:ankyrin repeat protein